MNPTKPFSPACERNQEPILKVLTKELPANTKSILEVGSGTGQHAVYFGQHLPQVQWQTADLPNRHQGIQMWLDEFKLDNVLRPLALDLLEDNWEKNLALYDAVYTANTMHIVPWLAIVNFFRGVPHLLKSQAPLLIYGPFCYKGQFTSASNQQFDQSLRERDSEQGLRNFEDLLKLAEQNDLKFIREHDMPANNQTLVFRKPY